MVKSNFSNDCIVGSSKIFGKTRKNFWIAVIPALFMTVVVTSYIICAPEGFAWVFGNTDIHVVEQIGIVAGIIVSALAGLLFWKTKQQLRILKWNKKIVIKRKERAELSVRIF